MSALFPRCQVLPVADHQVHFLIDGAERCRWHFGTQYPRPFLYPLRGPSGAVLTRMGHPGAPNHDHHQSVWFAHNHVQGVNFWANTSPATIRQQEWLAYVDGDEEAIFAAKLGWYDGHDPQELMTQEVVLALRPESDGETWLEVQSTFTPVADQLELGKTNFGFLAVRVAKSLSTFFGGGRITDSEGRAEEINIFAQQARWMDYSGPTAPEVTEGITFFDHPSNPGHPTHWHVREDGWMGAAFNLQQPYLLEKATPLRLRYLLHTHNGPANLPRAQTVFDHYTTLPPLLVRRSKTKNTTYDVVRKP